MRGMSVTTKSIEATPTRSGACAPAAGAGARTFAALVGGAGRDDTVCRSKRRPRALVTSRMVDQVGLPSAESEA